MTDTSTNEEIVFDMNGRTPASTENVELIQRLRSYSEVWDDDLATLRDAADAFAESEAARANLEAVIAEANRAADSYDRSDSPYVEQRWRSVVDRVRDVLSRAGDPS